MSRRLFRHDQTLTGSGFETLVTVPADHKYELIGCSRFLVATSGTLYLNVLTVASAVLFLDQIDFAGTEYVVARSYPNIPMVAGESLQAAFSGAGFIAAALALSLVDVDFLT